MTTSTGGIRKWEVLDDTPDELDVLRAGGGGVGPGEGEHLIGHVDAVDETALADPPGRQQHVDATAGAEVKDGLTLAQLGDEHRVAATEAGGDRGTRQLALLPR